MSQSTSSKGPKSINQFQSSKFQSVPISSKLGPSQLWAQVPPMGGASLTMLQSHCAVCSASC